MPRTKQPTVVDVVQVAPTVLSKRDELLFRVVERYVARGGSLDPSVVNDLVAFVNGVAKAANLS